MAPDGSRVAFVRVSVNRQKEQYETSIWVAATGAGATAPQPFTSGPRDSNPRWSPDGTRLAFVRAAETEGRVQPPQIYVMIMTGGEPRAVTDIPRGAGAPAWAPDSKAIAFSSSARPDELPGVDKAAAKPSNGEGAKRQSDVRLITDAAYRANGISGAGYVDADRTSQIWVTTLPDSNSIVAPLQVTTGEFGAANHQWSPDGNDIYFVSNRRHDAYYYPDDSDLYAVSRRGGEPRRIADIEGSIGPYAVLRATASASPSLPQRTANPSGPTISPTSGSPTSPVARRATSPPPTTSTSAARLAAISARRAASIRRPRSGRPPGRASSFASVSRATPCSRRWMRRRDASIAPSRVGTSCRTPRTLRAGVSPP